MRELNRQTAGKRIYPERIIQFGEGNFLRAFVDWIIQKMNDQFGKVINRRTFTIKGE